MKKNKGYLVMLVLMIMLTGISIPAQAEDSTDPVDNCISLGYDALGFLSFEYERQVFNHLAVFVDYRQKMFDFSSNITGYSYGINYYFDDTPLNGLYVGLSQSNIHAVNIDLFGEFFRKLFGLPSPPTEYSDYVLITGALGYKKEIISNLTVDLAMLYSQSPSSNNGVFYTMVGFGLRW